MARLARVHFCGLGTDSARFNPVSLDFRNPEGRANHAVMWLRNGGGKTTMLSFLYSTLRPHSNDWLGRHNGRQTELLEYVKERQTGFVLLEFEFPGDVHRVVGQAISKRSAREPKRIFFTFRTDGSLLAWDKIPVTGLGDAAGSLELFVERLQALGEQPASGLEFYRTDRQNDWRNHLDSIGLDPEIYHTHLLMNADEGGLLNFFDFHSPEMFVEKLLDMAFETLRPLEENGERPEKEDLTAIIEKFRQKVFARPNLDATGIFCQHALAALEALRMELDVAAQFRQQRESYHIQGGRLLFSVECHLKALRSEVTQLENEKEISAKAKKDALNRRDDHRRFQRHYERRRRLLAIEEAKQALSKAEENRAREEVWLAALKSAYRQRRIEDCKRLIADFVRQKQELEKMHEPDRKALERLGCAISDLLGQRITRIKGQIDELTKSRNGSLTEQKNLQGDLLQTTKEISGANQSLISVRSFLNEVDQERRRLRDQGVLLPPSETGAEAVRRWQNKAQNHQDNANRLAAEIIATDTRTAGLRRQLKEKDGQREAITTEVSRLRTWLEGVNLQATRLQLEPIIIREIGENPGADLYNPSLESVLEKYADDCQQALLGKTVEGAADRRIVDYCRNHPNSPFPAPVGIDLVIEKLRHAGVTSAIPAYRWLSEYCEPGESSRRLLAQPALYSGIVVQASTELDKARIVIAAEGLELPVMVGSPADFATDMKAGQHVILPEEKGFYNAALAQINLPRVVNRVSIRDSEIGQLASDRKAIESVLTRLREFVRTYPSKSVEDKRGELTTQEQLLIAQDAAIEELNREIASLGERLNDLRGRKEAQEKEASSAREYLARAQAFVGTYESRVPGRREEERQLIAKIQELSGWETDLKGRLEILGELIPQLGSQIHAAQLDEQALALRRESLPAQFVGGEAESDVGEDLKTLFDRFESKRRDYEGRVQAGYYDAKIEEEQRRQSEIDAEQRRDSSRPSENDIALALAEPDLNKAVDQQLSVISNSTIEVTTARRSLDQAERDRPPPLAQSERDTPHPDLGIPGSAAQAAEFSKRCDELSQQFDADADKADENLTLVLNRLAGRTIAVERYDGLPNRLKRIIGDSMVVSEPSAEFQGEDAKDRAVVDTLESNFDCCQADLERAQKAAARVYTDDYHGVFQLRELEGKTIDAVERMRRLPRTDLEGRISFWIDEIRTHGKVVAQELADFDKERRTVLALMNDSVRDAETVLRAAENRSRMPDNMGAWAGHCFLKISVPRHNDQAERLVLLDRKLGEWIDSKNPKPIPTGAKLAYHCLVAIAGKDRIEVKILKPEYNLRPFLHDIVKLKSFSGGEQVTAAIILYCIIVKLRSQRRGREVSLVEDSGFLLLDNPLGKANLPDFVDLQISMADRMGVQYICGTGINDFDALAGFPKIIRLRNSSINPRTGANIVEVDGDKPTVTAISLGHNGNGKDGK